MNQDNTIPPREIQIESSSTNCELDPEEFNLSQVDNQFDEEIKRLAEKPDLPPTPNQVQFTLVDDDEPAMRRPLSLINGKGYAASWRKVKITDKSNGHDETTIENRIVVVREDGKVFGGENPISDLGIEVALPEGVDPNKYWSKNGIDAYRKGEHSPLAKVFSRLIDIINHFIDFNKSLADQITMCEFIACYILTTWGLDAFDVIGYLWIIGEKGSGKTNLLMLVSMLSYLGFLLSPSGTYAALRDLADNGATLACDDAENLTDPKKTDADKRAVMLAGNRKGVIVTLKEFSANKKWITRYVNAFCARAFSSISVPDSTLASRTILVPLLKTFGKKGNLDPMDHSLWPHDQKEILNDLWAFGLKNLSVLSTWNKWVGDNSRLNGRNLQPWRAVLAVAKLLDESGVAGLYQRMEDLSLSYQNKRFELESSDFNRVVLESLCDCAIRAINANSAMKTMKTMRISVLEITISVNKIIEEQDIDLESINIDNKSIGKVLAKLRFDKASRKGGQGSRMWEIDLVHLAGLLEAYNIEFLDRLLENGNSVSQYLSLNGSNGTNGIDGIEEDELALIDGNFDDNEPPTALCYMCDRSEYWQRPDGGWVCSTCHANPKSAVCVERL
jgi:hypothetical protein